MSFRLLTLLLLVYCCYFISATKRMRVGDKSYAVSAYPEDCTKYVMCSDGKCKLESCEPTYAFDPITSTCSHRRRTVNCDINLPRRL